MSGLPLIVALVGALALQLAPLRIRMLVAFLLMMQFFDVVPNLFLGMYVWDYGAILMLVTAVDLYAFKRVNTRIDSFPYLQVMRLLVGWLVICLAWSLIVYQYPVVHTIKNARYMVVGYAMTFIYLRFFQVERDGFEYLMKWTYRITYALMPVLLLQYLLKVPLMAGLVREYEGEVRAVPIFLPFILLNLWRILTRMVTGAGVGWRDALYATMAAIVIAITFTRGIYLAAIFGFMAVIGAASVDGRARAGALLRAAAVVGVALAVLVVSPVGQKVVGRAINGLSVLSGKTAHMSEVSADDTFHGRLGLAQERFVLSWDKNPLLGYGFIHEDDVPSELRSGLLYGTVLAGTAEDPEAYSRTYDYSSSFVLGFYTADISWADIVISTGVVGVALIIWVVVAFLVGHFVRRGGPHPLGYEMKTAIWTQILVLFLLTFDGNNFYGAVHIPALLFAGYALSTSSGRSEPKRPGNLLS